MSYWLYVGIYFLIVQMTPPHKMYKGVIWRNVIKAPPMKYVGRKWKHPVALALRPTARGGVAVQLWSIFVIIVLPVSRNTGHMLFWTPLIAAELADYLHDDDNFRKFFSEVRNKIKWKMKLPAPAPARAGTR
jgi:hypothetical protein